MAILLASFYFFYFSIVGVYIIFMPKVLSNFSYSAEEIGIIFAAAPLVRFILPMLFIKGISLNRRVFNLSLVVMVLSAISLYLCIDNFYLLLASNIGLGIGMSLALPFIEVISLEEIGKERYGKIRLFGSVGFMLVALVLVKLFADKYSALYFLIVLSVVTAIVAFVIGGHSSQHRDTKEEKIQNDITLLQDWKLWAGLVFMQLSFGAFYNFFTIYTTDNGISLQTTIYLWNFGVLIEILMLYFQGGLLQKNLLVILQITTLLTTFRWFLVFMFPSNLPILYFSQSIHAFSFALFHSAAIAYLFHLYKHKALAQQFFSGLSYGLGGLGGALLSGYIYEYIPEYLFLSATFLALGAFLFLRLYTRERKLLGKA